MGDRLYSEGVTIVVLFGAGASAFSGECYPKAPPLGAGLFDELRALGGIAADVSPQLANLFRENFELGMAAFQQSRRIDTPAFLRQMGDYFAKFEPGPGNFYVEVVRILWSSRRPFTIATLNYDLLFERAATGWNHRLSYHASPVPENNIPFLKLHGSCNFLPAYRQIRGVRFDLPGPKDVNVAGPVRVAQPEEVIRFCRTEDSLAPVMALYASGKQILYSPAFVQQQQRDWDRVVAEATEVYVVGVAVNVSDGHIWNPLAQTTARLFYVDPEPAAFHKWASTNRNGASSRIASTFEEFLSVLRDRLSQQ